MRNIAYAATAGLLSLAIVSQGRAEVSAADISLSDAAGRYHIEAKASRLAFSIANIAGGAIEGRFLRFGGTIAIDGEDIGRSHVDVTIEPASVTTGQARVDAFLKSDAVFDASRERAISFRSTAVRRTGARSAAIDGTLTARGRSWPAHFEAELSDLAPMTIGFHVRGKVLRSPFGMDVGTPIYSNVVVFDMDLDAVRR